MYAPSFNYYRAGSIAEVSTLLQQHPGAKLLAGGHSLLPILKLRLAAPPVLIDIGRLGELKGVAEAGGMLRVGALTTHAELAKSPVVRGRCPLLAEAAGHVGDPAVRNRGTIGGNVAHADPASDLPTVLAALDARFTFVSNGRTQTVGADRFFTGLMTTSLGEHDLLTSIEVPVQAAGQASAYAKFEHPASRYAVIGVATILTVEGGTCTAAAVAIGGLVPTPRRAVSVEAALRGVRLKADPADNTLSDAAARVTADLGDDIIGDLYASAEYRKAMAPIWVKRALTAAAGRVR